MGRKWVWSFDVVRASDVVLRLSVPFLKRLCTRDHTNIYTAGNYTALPKYIGFRDSQRLIHNQHFLFNNMIELSTTSLSLRLSYTIIVYNYTMYCIYLAYWVHWVSPIRSLTHVATQYLITKRKRELLTLRKRTG